MVTPMRFIDEKSVPFVVLYCLTYTIILFYTNMARNLICTSFAIGKPLSKTTRKVALRSVCEGSMKSLNVFKFDARIARFSNNLQYTT